MVSVFHTPRFDSGYIFGVRLRGLLEEFHMWTLVFQRNAWFNSGYKFMRQATVRGFCRARCCARHVPDGPDNAGLPGGAAGAVPARLRTSLCSCSDKFPPVPGRGSDPFIDKFETD